MCSLYDIHSYICSLCVYVCVLLFDFVVGALWFVPSVVQVNVCGCFLMWPEGEKTTQCLCVSSCWQLREKGDTTTTTGLPLSLSYIYIYSISTKSVSKLFSPSILFSLWLFYVLLSLSSTTWCKAATASPGATKWFILYVYYIPIQHNIVDITRCAAPPTHSQSAVQHAIFVLGEKKKRPVPDWSKLLLSLIRDVAPTLEIFL